MLLIMKFSTDIHRQIRMLSYFAKDAWSVKASQNGLKGYSGETTLQGSQED